MRNNAVNSSIKLKGNLAALFVWDPSKTTILQSSNVPLKACLPIYGHDYICISSNIGSNVLSATCGERLETTNLLGIVPTPNYPADIESYVPSLGKTETSSNIIDYIDLHFTDKYGNDVLSLDDFILTITIDQVKTEDFPPEDHVSLFNVRKQTADQMRNLTIQDMNKKLRISNNNVIY